MVLLQVVLLEVCNILQNISDLFSFLGKIVKKQGAEKKRLEPTRKFIAAGRVVSQHRSIVA